MNPFSFRTFFTDVLCFQDKDWRGVGLALWFVVLVNLLLTFAITH